MRPEKRVDLINRSLLHIYAVCTRSGRTAGGADVRIDRIRTRLQRTHHPH